jgi:membrane-associated phospholipid phosphatase
VNSKIARLISIILHPVFIPVLAVLALTHFHFLTSAKLIPDRKWIFIAAYAVSLTVVPLFGITLMLRKYTIKELSSLTRQERVSSAFVMAGVYFFIAFTFQTLFVDELMKVFVLALGASALTLSVISKYKRISFHTFAWAGMLVLMLAISRNAVFDMGFLVILTFILAALVAWSRLKLQVHTHWEVYLGFIIGFICNLLVYLIFYGI